MHGLFYATLLISFPDLGLKVLEVVQSCFQLLVGKLTYFCKRSWGIALVLTQKTTPTSDAVAQIFTQVK